MDDIVLARALHVLAVVHWIGGVAFARLVVLPLARSRPAAETPAPFTALEQRFASQVRISILLAGATGLWMTCRMNLWDRFGDPRFWWMSAMAGLWLAFMLMVFVFDPLLHDRFKRESKRDPRPTLRRVADLHTALLTLAAITMLGAVAGAQGFRFF
jgi:uncharacterized membrane protein